MTNTFSNSPTAPSVGTFGGILSQTTKMRFVFISTIFFLTVLTACNNSYTSTKTGKLTGTVASTNIFKPIITCDTFQTDKPKIKDYKKAYKIFLETTSIDWFLENRQSLWREAKAWHIKTFSVDSNSIIKCLCNNRQIIFLYIPNQFYNQEKNGNEYFRFYIVNNSSDTVEIPRLDNIVDNISSSVSTGDSLKWLLFQQTDQIIDCGNSIWTMKLPPKTATLSEIESDRINVGDTTVDYRIELNLDKQIIVSNSIKINLMKKQLPYLGKKFK